MKLCECGVEINERSTRCRPCQARKNGQALKRKRREDGKRVCTKCKTAKFASEFSRSLNASSWCKECCRRSAAQWRADHPDRVKQQELRRRGRYLTPEYQKWYRMYSLFNKYGITAEDFELLWKRCKGACEICKRPFGLGREGLNIDHDHASGKVRGVLCGLCNRGLGQFNDDVSKLRAAVRYLVQHGVLSDDLGS